MEIQEHDTRPLNVRSEFQQFDEEKLKSNFKFKIFKF